MRVKPHTLPSPCCDAPRARNETWDAYYCTACRAWLEPECGCAEGDRWCPVPDGPRPERAPA